MPSSGTVSVTYHKKLPKSIICFCLCAVRHICTVHNRQAIDSSGAGSAASGDPDQSPEPGSAEKNFSNFPSTPSISLASASGSRLTVIFGQTWA